MWQRLDSPGVVEALVSCCREQDGPVLERVIRAAASRPWASDLAVVTSMQNVFLTGSRSYEEQRVSGTIQLTVVGSEVSAAYCPPYSGEPENPVKRPVDEIIAAIDLMMIRLFDDLDRPHPDSLSKDNDPSQALLSNGVRVRVRLNERNRTARLGSVDRAVWHHKNECWHYFIKDNGKKVKKRYAFEDLVLERAG